MLKRMIWPAIIGVVGTAILVWLGVWQVHRLQWKQDILSRIEERIAEDPIPLPETPRQERDQYQPVTANGTILPGEIRILASLRDAGPVFRIIRAYETDDGRRILIDMGFVPEGARDMVRVGGPAHLVGNLYWPDEIDGFTPDPDLEAGIWFARDIPAMAATLDTEPVLVVLRERPETDLGVTPFPVDTTGIPNDHLSYAITWFLLAIAWMGMTLFLLWRISKRTI